jgi:ribonucleoside-diphosphate reductase alpha chain
MKILESQIETGTPYILYKDQANKKSNQSNIGTIKSSNLCAEILLYSDNQEYAVCNLASIALPKYVEIDPETKAPVYNHQRLFEIAKHIVLPMNNIIDFNHYPVPETKKSNLAHRPIGIGIQGLSDTYIKMRLPFESEQAKKLNKEIFETIYFALLTGSMELSKIDGPYSTFKGSPMSEGKFQFDLWAEHNGIDLSEYLSGRWDWESLRQDIKQYGVRNSTLTTCMPTASSAQIMGNTESFEQFDSCIFKRRVLSGEYIVANKHLVEDLTRLKLWDKDLKDLIIANNGSIQNIDIIPDDIKELYKTVWEITMKNFIEQSAGRGPFIDMTQSLNLFMASPTIKKLTSMHFYAWKQGLKTGIYYLRSKASAGASKFTIDPAMEKRIKEKQKKGKSLTKKEEEAVLMCSIENKEACMMCTS